MVVQISASGAGRTERHKV